MRHDPASGAIVIMLRELKMHGMAQAVGELTEQGSPAFGAAVPILSQLLKAEMAEAEAIYRDILPAIVFVMQSIDHLICYGKRLVAARPGPDLEDDVLLVPMNRCHAPLYVHCGV